MRRLLILPTVLLLSLPAGAGAALPAAPSVSTGGVRDVGFAQATLTGTLNPRGTATVYYFQYGPTSRYGRQTPLLGAPAVSANLKVSATIGGLVPLTSYHYRLVAANAGGTRRGTDRSFRTSPVALSLTIQGQPATITFGSPVLVAGSLTGSFNANRDVVLQANPFPYTAGFTNIGNPELTNAAGGFVFTVLGLTSTSQLRVVSIGKPTVTSPVTYETVSVRVSERIRHRGRRLRFTGTVTPSAAGSAVAIQRLARRRWVTVGGTVTRTTRTPGRARFSKLLHARRHGLYRVYVRPNDGGHAVGTSPPVRV